MTALSGFKKPRIFWSSPTVLYRKVLRIKEKTHHVYWFSNSYTVCVFNDCHPHALFSFQWKGNCESWESYTTQSETLPMRLRTGREGIWEGVVVVTVLISIFVAGLMKTQICEIASSCHSVDEVVAFEGCYTAYVGYLLTFRTAHRSRIEGSSSEDKNDRLSSNVGKSYEHALRNPDERLRHLSKNAVQNSRLRCRVELLYEDEELYTMRPEDNTRQCTQHCPTDRSLQLLITRKQTERLQTRLLWICGATQ